MLESLLINGADKFINDIIKISIIVENNQFVIEHESDCSHHTTYGDNSKVIERRFIMKTFGIINKPCPYTALSMASFQNNIDIVNLLMEYDADQEPFIEHYLNPYYLTTDINIRNIFCFHIICLNF